MTLSRDLHPPKRAPKRVLAVRVLVAKGAWLEGRLRWQDGRVVWEGAQGRFAPTPADLARTQRSLNKIADYPISAELALHNSEAWLRERWARLELAKQLCALQAPDLPALTKQVHNRNPQVVQRLVSLLLAEALCLNTLPAAPSAALLACGERAEAALLTFLGDETVPQPARALAALILGAIHRIGSNPKPKIQNPKWASRSYAWGAQFGLREEPALIAALLVEEDGAALAHRCLDTVACSSPFCLTPELLREKLAEGVPAAQVVALAEAASSGAGLARRMLRPPEPLKRTQANVLDKAWREERQKTVAGLSEALVAYTRATSDPQAVRLVFQFAQAILDLGEEALTLPDGFLIPLRAGLELPAHLHRPFLEILTDYQPAVWDKATQPTGNKPTKTVARFHDWLRTRWYMEAKPLCFLLRVTEDPAFVRETWTRGLHSLLGHHRWRDPDLYRYMLALTRDFNPALSQCLTRLLPPLFDHFPNARAARAALHPLFQATRRLKDPTMQIHFIECALDAIPRTTFALRETLPRLTRYLPRLLRFTQQTEDSADCLCSSAIYAALALDRSAPDHAAVWLGWLLDTLAETLRSAENAYAFHAALERGVPLAITLAGGDLNRFQALFHAMTQHEFYQHPHLLERSAATLERFPALRAPLALVFPQQPLRCARLLERVGLVTRLGADALAPLAALELPTANAGSSESDWQALLTVAPELAETVAIYRHAQALLGGTDEVPPGVRRALERPRRLVDELAYVERALAETPERPGLAARAASLRALLDDPERLMEMVREEVGKRIQQVTAEAQIAAAEQQVTACYRSRLNTVAGPLPPERELDADLLNATLLTVDIQENRKLLVKLLRAYLSGDRAWRERQPGNETFLRELAARGVDVDAWLGAHPRVFRCAAAVGGRVRLVLETDPLHILQMGNYFDTCLSFGGFNAFSTVANACELNKRVVYARDGAGRIVGRKLIALDSEGCLVGFHTYTTMTDGVGNLALRALFRRYLTDFAARCSLPMADHGEVPTLFAERWYNDGVVAWNDEEVSSTPSKRRPTHAG